MPLTAFLREQFAERAVEVADTVAEGLKESFLRYSAEHGLKVVEKVDGAGPSISWVEKEGKQVDVIKLYGRLSDLIIVAKPDRDKNLGTNTLKASLFNTGRPVLMCPDKETAPTTLGEHVAIAWNGSVESVRSVSLNIDILFNASAVTILTADQTELHSATAQDLADYLAVREIETEIDESKSPGKTGHMQLKRTAVVGADILIMGAYSNSHEHETIFSGNTQVVIDNANIPVVMVH